MINTLAHKRSLLQLNTILKLSNTVIKHLPDSDTITVMYNKKAPTNNIHFGEQELKFEDKTYFYASSLFFANKKIKYNYSMNIMFFVPKYRLQHHT